MDFIQNCFSSIIEREVLDQLLQLFREQEIDLHTQVDICLSNCPDFDLNHDANRNADIPILADLFPHYSTELFHSVLLVQGGLHNSIDYLLSLDSTTQGKLKKNAPSLEPLKHTFADISRTPRSLNFTPEKSPRKILHLSSSHSLPNIHNTKDDNYSAQQCKENALYHAEQRKIYFHKAAELYTTQTNSAHFTSQGIYHSNMYTMWIRKAGECISGRETADDNLDLHGLDTTTALEVLQTKLAVIFPEYAASSFSDSFSKWNCKKAVGYRKNRVLTVITGAGNHSTNRKPILLPAISAYLTKNHWKFKQVKGSLVIEGKM